MASAAAHKAAEGGDDGDPDRPALNGHTPGLPKKQEARNAFASRAHALTVCRVKGQGIQADHCLAVTR